MNEQQVRVGTTLEDSVLVGESSESGISTQSVPFNPNDVLQCNVRNQAEHVLETVENWPYGSGSQTIWPGGDIDLLYGTENTSGFKHIRDRHQYASTTHPNGWETYRASASSALGYEAPQSWDEYMMHAIHDTLDYSSPLPRINSSSQSGV